MKSFTTFIAVGIYAIGVFAAAIDASTGDIVPVDAAAEESKIAARNGAFSATCWDFAVEGSRFWASCHDGHGQKPRTFVDLNDHVANRGGILTWDV